MEIGIQVLAVVGICSLLYLFYLALCGVETFFKRIESLERRKEFEDIHESYIRATNELVHDLRIKVNNMEQKEKKCKK